MRLGEAFHYVYLKPKWSRGGTEIPQGMMGVLHIVFNLERSNTQRVCGAEGGLMTSSLVSDQQIIVELVNVFVLDVCIYM